MIAWLTGSALVIAFAIAGLAALGMIVDSWRRHGALALAIWRSPRCVPARTVRVSWRGHGVSVDARPVPHAVAIRPQSARPAAPLMTGWRAAA